MVDIVAQKATVDSCVWDTDVLYGPPTKPGGPETIVNNLRFSKMYQHDLYLEDGAWKIGEMHELSRGPEGVEPVPAQTLRLAGQGADLSVRPEGLEPQPSDPKAEPGTSNWC